MNPGLSGNHLVCRYCLQMSTAWACTRTCSLVSMHLSVWRRKIFIQVFFPSFSPPSAKHINLHYINILAPNVVVFNGDRYEDENSLLLHFRILLRYYMVVQLAHIIIRSAGNVSVSSFKQSSVIFIWRKFRSPGYASKSSIYSILQWTTKSYLPWVVHT